MTPDDVDLSDLDNFTAGPPFEMFDVLRRSKPLHFNAEPAPNAGFWSLTRHADIVAVGRDHETFSSERGAVNLEELDAGPLEIRKSMLETDGERHSALRRLLQRDFAARSLLRYEDFLRGITATTVDAALPKGEFDFVKEISADLPIRVLARLLDIPDADTGQLIEWGNRMIGNTDPDQADVLLYSDESDRYRELPFRSPAALEVFAYGDALRRQRQGGSGLDLVSKLVNTEPEDGVPLSAREFRNYFLLLVVAGNETTRHAISHGMLALIQHPDQLAMLRDRPQLIGAAVEEFLRWAPPVYHFRRTATREVELHGRRIGEGDKVVMWYVAGNRDESVFVEPYRLDVARTPNDHLTFGKGPHFCLGAALARMEMRVMFEELLPRLADIEVSGDIRWVRSNFINGIKAFPVKVKTA